MQLTVRYVCLGAMGQRQEQSFTSAAAADCHAEKLIAAKLRQGYREVALV